VLSRNGKSPIVITIDIIPFANTRAHSLSKISHPVLYIIFMAATKSTLIAETIIPARESRFLLFALETIKAEKVPVTRAIDKLEIIVYHQGYCHGQNNIDHDGKPQISKMDISIVAMNMGIIKGEYS